jgi:hypothetical protein
MNEVNRVDTLISPFDKGGLRGILTRSMGEIPLNLLFVKGEED